MKVLLLQDVYKLGRAGDVKKVADGYGRNFLIPQGLAMLATAGAMKQAERIRAKAEVRRAVLNNEMGAVAELMKTLSIEFSARAASETDKLYGSVSMQMIADEIKKKIGVEINRRQIDHQPIRNLGLYKVPIRLTMDLVPEVTVNIFREGEAHATSAPEPTPAAVEVMAEDTDEPVRQSSASPDAAEA